MSSVSNGGPAFPCSVGIPDYGNVRPVEGPGGQMWETLETGITIRDYFAAKALNGFISILASPSKGNSTGNGFEAEIAANCYLFADAMLEARKK